MDVKEFIEDNNTMIEAVIATGKVAKGIKKLIAKTVDGQFFVCSFYERQQRISAGRASDDIDTSREYFYNC